MKPEKVWTLYKIINLLNNKVYIGQTIEPRNRWYQHRRDAANPKYPIHHAINKYGADNFIFEIVASCKSQEDANYSEELLIKQYDSLVQNNKGYNISLGGTSAPKSDEFKKALSNWHASLSPEEKAKRSASLREATLKQIETKGHPAQGRKLTDEQKAKLITMLNTRDNEKIYSQEVRQRMSESHIGKPQTKESVEKRAATIRKNKGDMVCGISGCGEIKDRRHAPIVNGIRYCGKHGWHAKKSVINSV